MMHLLMVAVLKFDATYATLADQLGHLKPPCIITALIRKNLPEKNNLLDSCYLCGFDSITDVTTSDGST